MKKIKLTKAGKIWLAVAAAVVVLAIGLRVLDVANWEKLDIERLTNLNSASVVYAADNSEVGTLYGAENRVFAPLYSIPKHVQDAFVAAEDQRFYSHNGVDIVRLFGALWHDIRTTSYAQGASTITQQLIKLTHLSGDKTLSRKAQEIFLALQAERALSKDQILEAYLNVVYFGNGAYGVQAASELFFGKDVSELSVSEGALLAGVIKSPNNYSPLNDPGKAVERRNLVLDDMVVYGVLSEEEGARAKEEPLALAEAHGESAMPFGWYMDAVCREAQEVLGLEIGCILNGGYKIYTALDPEAQSEAERLFAQQENFPNDAADDTPCQASLIAMNTKNGEITALIGGREYSVRFGLDRSRQTKRQPGSTVKPLSTYAAAIETRGYLPSSFLTDEERTYAGNYSPGNADGRFYGLVTMRQALARSMNGATVALADSIGVAGIRNMLSRFGIPLHDNDANLALSLGAMTDGVSLDTLCGAYCSLANGGSAVKPHLIRSIVDKHGKVVYRASETDRRVVSDETAYMITDMLRTAVESGSAKALRSVSGDVAAKTGTVAMENGGNRDAWTVAYTPEMVVGVWMGFDRPDSKHKLPDNAGGSSYPAQLCAAFLSAMPEKWRDERFSMPATLRRVLIDSLTLEEDHAVVLANNKTPRTFIQSELFPLSDIPKAVTQKWNIPQTVNDLALSKDELGQPVLTFTALENHVEYLVMRKSKTATENVAVLQAKTGEVIQFTDETANSSLFYRYSVIPRHALLYKQGNLVTGNESSAVEFAPDGLINGLLSLLESDAQTAPKAASERLPETASGTEQVTNVDNKGRQSMFG